MVRSQPAHVSGVRIRRRVRLRRGTGAPLEHGRPDLLWDVQNKKQHVEVLDAVDLKTILFVGKKGALWKPLAWTESECTFEPFKREKLTELRDVFNVDGLQSPDVPPACAKEQEGAREP